MFINDEVHKICVLTALEVSSNIQTAETVVQEIRKDRELLRNKQELKQCP